MSIYLSAIIMLAATLAAFIILTKLLQTLRNGGITLPWRGGARSQLANRLEVEQACAIDGKRRLVLVRCDEQRVLLLTGGPADLVVTVFSSAGARI